MLAPFTFLLPADSGEKISLGVTILLSLTVFQLIVAEQMPPSEDIPIIGEFYLYTMALVSTSILVTIGMVTYLLVHLGQNADKGPILGVLSLHYGPADPPPVPDWLNRITKLSAVQIISRRRITRRLSLRVVTIKHTMLNT